LDVIIELVKRNVCDKFDSTTAIEQVPTPLAVILKHLSSFRDMINKEDNEGKVVLSTGELKPLGFRKLKIVQFCAPLFATNYKSIGHSLIKTDLLGVLLSLFFSYEWNNFLHLVIQQMVNTILEGEDNQLKEYLIIDAGLVTRIIKASKLSDDAQDLPKGCRKGYMGFVTNMTVNIVNAAKGNEKISNYLNTCEGWNEYLNGSFSEIRGIETSNTVKEQSSSGEDVLHETPLFYNPQSPNEEEEEFHFGDDNDNAFNFGNTDQWVEEPDSDSVDSDEEDAKGEDNNEKN